MATLKCQMISNFVPGIEQSKELSKEKSKALSKLFFFFLIQVILYFKVYLMTCPAVL